MRIVRRAAMQAEPRPRGHRPREPLGAGRSLSGGRSGVGRPLIDPRFGERRMAARRHESRRRLRAVAIVAGVVTLGIGGVALLHSSVLAVGTVQVTGVSHTSRASVRSAAQLSRLMIDVEGSRAARRIERLPWVADARIERHWPSRVQISVVERQPVAVVSRRGAGAGTASGGGSNWTLVDRSARVLADVPQPPPGLVVLSGVGDPGAPGTRLEQGAGPALDAVVDLAPSLAQRVATVNAVGAGDLEMVLRPVPGTPEPITPSGSPPAVTGHPGPRPAPVTPTGATVVLGGTDQLDAKLQALALLVNQADLAGVRSVDLRVPQSPALTRG